MCEYIGQVICLPRVSVVTKVKVADSQRTASEIMLDGNVLYPQ